MAVRDIVMAAAGSSGGPVNLSWGPIRLTNGLFKIAFSGSLYVAVGSGGTIITSSDQTSWSSRASGTTENLNRVVWVNSLFIAVGNNGTILTSSDGTTWTSRNSGTSENLHGVTWSGSLYVVVGANGTIRTSTNLTSWSAQTSGTSNILYDVAFANSSYCVVGSSNTALRSSDGTTWTTNNTLLGSGVTLYTVKAFQFGSFSYFFAVGSGGSVSYVNTTSSSWVIENSTTTANLLDITRFQGTSGNYSLAAIGLDGLDNGVICRRNSSGTSWDNAYFNYKNTYGLTSRVTGSSGSFVDELIVVTAGPVNSGLGGFDSTAVLTSSSGSTWAFKSSYVYTNLPHKAIWTGSQFVAVGSHYLIMTSPDGLAWTNRSVGSPQSIQDAFLGIAFSGTRYIAVGAASSSSLPVAYTSTNSTSWTVSSTGVSQALSDVAWSGSLFAVVGRGGTIITTTDASAWTLRTSGTTNNLNAIVWSGSQFVCVGNGGVIRTSPDGVTWTSRTSGVTEDLSRIAWSGSLFVAINTLTDIYPWVLTSSDGITWTKRTVSFGGRAQNIVWTGSAFLAMGGNNFTGGFIQASSDGITWTLQDLSSISGPGQNGPIVRQLDCSATSNTRTIVLGSYTTYATTPVLSLPYPTL